MFQVSLYHSSERRSTAFRVNEVHPTPATRILISVCNILGLLFGIAGVLLLVYLALPVEVPGGAVKTAGTWRGWRPDVGSQTSARRQERSGSGPSLLHRHWEELAAPSDHAP
jgi:hypothetical protein